MILRYHEAPVALFKDIQNATDGDYALVHLFEENTEYYNLFKQAVASGRDVILDNSIFELGEAFDSRKYAEWILKLRPTWYIVPDCWKDKKGTIRAFREFVNKYPNLPGKRIGVAQGQNTREVAECYKVLEPQCDMIAFNMDFATESGLSKDYPYCIRMSVGRVKVLSRLYEKGIINRDKPHHLLGCGVPQEAMMYPNKWHWIRSIDTSNPVVHGLLGVHYGPHGLYDKSDLKLCSIVDAPVNHQQWTTVMNNIVQFRQFCSNDRSVTF